MLGIAALAELALAEFPPTAFVAPPTVTAGPAWRRLAAYRHPGSRLNTGPPEAILRRMREEEDIMILLATLQ